LWWDIDSHAAKFTGCLLPCTYELYSLQHLKYEFEERENFDFGIGLTNGTAYGIQIFYLDDMTTEEEEFFAFDVYSLLGEIGGAIGLFLGWSCRGIFHRIEQYFFSSN